MRKQDSFFNEVAAFINSIPVGETFTSAQYINAVGGGEKVTRWKILSRNTNYRAHQYKGMLKRYFLQHVKRGTWKVTRHIPEWFTTAHLWTLNYYTNTYKQRYDENGKYHYDPTPRTTLSRDEILAKLEVETNTTEIFHKMANSIADESVIGKTTPEDPMYYASGAYVVEKAIEANPGANVIKVLSGVSELPTFSVKKISEEDSQFFGPKNTKADMLNELRENIGLVRSAAMCMENATCSDPIIQARMINISEQLNSLLTSMSNRINL